MSIHVFGIRHHGPGSAKSLREALRHLEPDIVLLEGPPEGDSIVHLANHQDMHPPVAMLIYPTDGDQKLGAYYPFAVFSPEWAGIQHGMQNGLPVRFIDLPQTHQMALNLNRGKGVDAFSELAHAAGYEDGERWWETLIEQRTTQDIFDGILEAMAALREVAGPARDREALREAWMRKCIRAAVAEGHQKIAVICGAWHAPLLIQSAWPKASEDDKLLKGLPKRKVEATWVPWTYDRLSFDSGYGAGVDSPEYYHLLWEKLPGEVAVHWMVSAAQLLRSHDLQASSASAVEAVRLAETLATLQRRPLPGLEELEEAARAVYAMGGEKPMQLIRKKLVMGERMGEVPEEAPQVPLARDLAALQKRLRLPPEASHKDIDLDLRKPTDRERSLLLHRLNLLNIPWGRLREARGTGTFRESWRLQWHPEFALEIVQAAPWGNTVVEACAGFVAAHCDDFALVELTTLAEKVLLADLAEALERVLAQIQERAALSSDPGHLLETLPPFARILRYPDVRQTDATLVRQVVGGLLERIAIGLPLACSSLDDDAADEMFRKLGPAHAALMLLDQTEWLSVWRGALLKLADIENLHGLIRGRAVWILLDIGQFDPSEASRRLGLALSRAADGPAAAAFVEGFLRDNGELLVHARELFDVIDGWVNALEESRFVEVLPLLRRTFSSFSPGVRRNLGGTLGEKAAVASVATLDENRVQKVLPIVRQLLGLSV